MLEDEWLAMHVMASIYTFPEGAVVVTRIPAVWLVEGSNTKTQEQTT